MYPIIINKFAYLNVDIKNIFKITCCLTLLTNIYKHTHIKQIKC